MRVERLNVCLDFDGVISQFNGWVGEFTFEEPVEGAKEFLEELSEQYRVVILTARPDIAEVWKWLNKYGMSGFVDGVTNTKIPGVMYVDDRGITFKGDFISLREEMKNFTPWWS